MHKPSRAVKSWVLGVASIAVTIASVLAFFSARVHVPLTQLSQLSPDVAAAVAADGELAIELPLTLPAWAVRAGELIEAGAVMAAWDGAGMRNTRSIAEVASPRHRGIERRIASHLPPPGPGPASPDTSAHLAKRVPAPRRQPFAPPRTYVPPPVITAETGHSVGQDDQRQARYRASSSPGTAHVVGPAPGDDRARPGNPLIEELRAGPRHREGQAEPAGDITRRQPVMQSSRASVLPAMNPSRDTDNAVPITPIRLLLTAQPRLPVPCDEGEPRKSSEQARKRPLKRMVS